MKPTIDSKKTTLRAAAEATTAAHLTSLSELLAGLVLAAGVVIAVWFGSRPGPQAPATTATPLYETLELQAMLERLAQDLAAAGRVTLDEKDGAQVLTVVLDAAPRPAKARKPGWVRYTVQAEGPALVRESGEEDDEAPRRGERVLVNRVPGRPPRVALDSTTSQVRLEAGGRSVSLPLRRSALPPVRPPGAGSSTAEAQPEGPTDAEPAGTADKASFGGPSGLPSAGGETAGASAGGSRVTAAAGSRTAPGGAGTGRTSRNAQTASLRASAGNRQDGAAAATPARPPVAPAASATAGAPGKPEFPPPLPSPGGGGLGGVQPQAPGDGPVATSGPTTPPAAHPSSGGPAGSAQLVASDAAVPDQPVTSSTASPGSSAGRTGPAPVVDSGSGARRPYPRSWPGRPVSSTPAAGPATGAATQPSGARPGATPHGGAPGDDPAPTDQTGPFERTDATLLDLLEVGGDVPLPGNVPEPGADGLPDPPAPDEER